MNKRIASGRYADIDAKRRQADAKDIKELKDVEKHNRKGGKNAS